MAIREARPGEVEKAAAAAAAATSTSSPSVGLPVAHPTTPYWLQSPSPALLGFRSTPQLPTETVDVAVVGTGITGAFAADALAGHGLSVVVLEAREACFGATGRNGGHCHPQIYATPPEVAAFELATFGYLRDFVEAHDIACDWRTLPGGGVHAYLDEELFALARQAVDLVKRTRPDLAGLVEAVSRTGQSGPSGPSGPSSSSYNLRLREPVVGAVVQTHASSVWPYKLVAWVLERLVRSQSINLQTNTPVLAIQPASRRDGHPEDDQWLLQTPRGTLHARRVLLATNAYTGYLLPSLADLIVPVRGQVAALVPPQATVPAARAHLDYSYVFVGGDDRDEYLVQQPYLSGSGSSPTPGSSSPPGGHLILGGGRNHAAAQAVGEWHDDVIETPVAAYLRSNLTPVLDVNQTPAPSPELPADWEWTGIMGFSRDHFPWIGELPSSLLGTSSSSSSSSSGLFLCAGFTGHGMPRTALAGRAVAADIRASLGRPGAEADPALANVQLPSAFRLSLERVHHARTACEDVAVSDAEGLKKEFQDFLASQASV